MRIVILSNDDEWRRVRDNPHNVIVSDSIKDLLEPDSFGLSDEDLGSQDINVTIGLADGSTVDGVVVTYEKSSKKLKLSFLCDKSSTYGFFLDNNVKSLRVHSEKYTIDKAIDITDAINEPVVRFQFFNAEIDNNVVSTSRAMGTIIIRL